MERLLLLSDAEVDGDAVELALPASARPKVATDSGTGTLAERVDAFERNVLLSELERHGNHMTDTARTLGLERSHLYKKCQQLGIDLRAIRKAE